jgi:hypothetical protein
MKGKEIPVTTADGQMRTSVARPDRGGRFGVKPPRSLLAAESAWLVCPQFCGCSTDRSLL